MSDTKENDQADRGFLIAECKRWAAEIEKMVAGSEPDPVAFLLLHVADVLAEHDAANSRVRCGTCGIGAASPAEHDAATDHRFTGTVLTPSTAPSEEPDSDDDLDDPDALLEVAANAVARWWSAASGNGTPDEEYPYALKWLQLPQHCHGSRCAPVEDDHGGKPLSPSQTRIVVELVCRRPIGTTPEKARKIITHVLFSNATLRTSSALHVESLDVRIADSGPEKA